MASLNCEVPHKIQVLMIMSKLTHPIYNHITSMFVAKEEMVAIEDVERLCRLAWEQKETKKAPFQAAKIFAVKPAPRNKCSKGSRTREKALPGMRVLRRKDKADHQVCQS